MNKRLKKKMADGMVGASKSRLKEDVRFLQHRLYQEKQAKHEEKCKVNRLALKVASMNMEHKLEIDKLKAQNKTLTDSIQEETRMALDILKENDDLQLENIELKNRNLFERIINKGVRV